MNIKLMNNGGGVLASRIFNLNYTERRVKLFTRLFSQGLRGDWQQIIVPAPGDIYV